MSTAWTSRYAQRTKGLKSSAIRELLKFTQRPEVISFAGGLPAPEVFPAERFQEACQKVLQEKPHLALQYGATEGYEPLREMVARHIARYGIKAKSENVLITSGSQQALDLIGKLLINPGDRVLVEAPTYLGALQAFNVYGADYVSVPSDDDGLRSDLLEDPLRSGPKFMPSAAGEAKVEGKKTNVEIDAKFQGLEDSSKFGLEYLTFVLWAISPQGRPVNLGELTLDHGRGHIKTFTDMIHRHSSFTFNYFCVLTIFI